MRKGRTPNVGLTYVVPQASSLLTRRVLEIREAFGVRECPTGRSSTAFVDFRDLTGKAAALIETHRVGNLFIATARTQNPPFVFGTRISRRCAGACLVRVQFAKWGVSLPDKTAGAYLRWENLNAKDLRFRTLLESHGIQTTCRSC